MNATERNAFIIATLLPTAIAWGFTEANLAHAIGMLNLPKSFTIYRPRSVQVIQGVAHRQKMRDRGETMTETAVLDTKSSPAGTVLPKSTHVFIFITKIGDVPSLRADWQTLPEDTSGSAQRSREQRSGMYRPKLPNIDPGHGGHTADVGARKLQKLLDR